MIEVDERLWPLVVDRFGGQVSMAEMNEYLARQDALLARDQHALSIVPTAEPKL